jgi:hypothetical protein
MRRLTLLLLLLALASAPFTLHAAASDDTWMKVVLDGRKIGQLHSTRRLDGDRVVTTDEMAVTLDRAGVALSITSTERSVETRDGKPLGFSATTAFSGIATTIEGRVENGQAIVKTTAGGRVDERTLPWPDGALLAEGIRLAEERHGLEPGTQYRLLAFQPSNLIAVPVEVEVKGLETVDIDGRRRRLTRVSQVLELPGAPWRTDAWVDRDHELHKATMPLAGVEFEMIVCSRRCATAPNQSADILKQTLVDAPRALPAADRALPLEYRIDVRVADAAALPNVAEQRAERADGGWTVRVTPGGSRDTEAPGAIDRAATRWLEADAQELVAIASREAGDGDARTRMRNLERFVRGYIEDKSLDVGYASALETLRSREGDCTEHALLLAALGRAAGVPTRVVNGLAYAPSFGGRDHVFVPHAWVTAWTGERWESFDAALPGFDAGHVALSSGDGDPSGFFAGVSLLGNVAIRDVRRDARAAADAADR